jgi:hypothetical protein
MDGSPRFVSEVSEASKGGDMDGIGDRENGEVGDDGYCEVVLCAKGLVPTLGNSIRGNEKRFLDLLIVLEEG